MTATSDSKDGIRHKASSFFFKQRMPWKQTGLPNRSTQMRFGRTWRARVRHPPRTKVEVQGTRVVNCRGPNAASKEKVKHK